MNWRELLIACAKSKKPLVLSTGMATYKEVKKSFKIISEYSGKVSLLHCVSSYPANIKSCNLRSIDFLKSKFKCKVGWSDHTVNPLVIYNVIKKHKADLIELHFDLDGEGWEEKEGNHHCWLPRDIKKVFSYLKNENLIQGNFKKHFSLEERNERKFRSDPSDGLRPLKNFRNIL